MKKIAPWSAGDVQKAGRFLLFFIFFFVAGTLLLDFVVPNSARQELVASATLAVLQATGTTGHLDLSAGHTWIILDRGNTIQISDLCTGTLEFLIIIGAILASAGIDRKKRVLGAAMAGVLVLLLNLARILATIGLIGSTQDTQLIDFTHNVFFRVFLFVSIMGLYTLWFAWAVGKDGPQKKKE